MAHKYATVSGVVTWSGGKTVLAAGRTTADPDHPLVRERPDLWTDEEPAAHLAAPSRVERATARPGERRGGLRRG